MILARPLVKALHEHWPLVAALALKGRTNPFWSRDELFQVARGLKSMTPQDAEESIRQLVGRGILVSLGSRDEFQLHAPTREFVLSLTQEHELGLAEMIRVQVEELGRLGQEIQHALAAGDLAAMHHPLVRVSTMAQSISLQLERDLQAILNIADRAKTHPTNTPLAERYREVIESYDRYVEPMNQMLQRDSSGFAELTERIEDTIEGALEFCDQRGALITQRRRLTGTAYTLRVLRSTTRERLARCTETLLPLREEYQRCNAIAIAVAGLLSRVRKRGLGAAIPAGRLKLGGVSRTQRVVPGRYAKAYMADLLHYSPEPVVFPETHSTPPQMQPRLRWQEVVEQVQRELPVPDLLVWLLHHYPEQEEKEILRLYHVVVHQLPLFAQLADQQVRHRLREHSLRLHPHQIEAPP